MLSLSHAKTAGSAVAYFADHLNPDNEPVRNSAEDYYSAEGDPGLWAGSGAAVLGLGGQHVDAQTFAGLALGVGPGGEELLQGFQRQQDPEKRRAGWDATFSAPKSVSIAWGLGSEQQRASIQKAHDEAISAALKKLEAEALFTRRGKGGQVLENGKLVAAVFQHGSNREQEPHLHSHAFIMNLSQREDGSWGGIQSKEIFKRKMLLGAFYRVALAENLKELGFQVEQDNKGSFRLAGFDLGLEKHFSSRRASIEARLAATGRTGAKASEQATLATRSAKERVGREKLLEGWLKEGQVLDAQPDQLTPEALALRAQEQEKVAREDALAAGEEYVPPPTKMPGFHELMREATERASTLSEYQLQALVYQKSQGILSPAEADDYLRDLLESEHVIRLKSGDYYRYTSREMYELEQQLGATAEAMHARAEHGISPAALKAALAARATLSDEQRAMVEHVTAASGIAAVQGAAGAGKSFALGAAKQAWEFDGRQVLGCALAGKAAEELEKGSGIESSTIHRLLIQLENGELELNQNSVIVVDEAGMVGSRLLSRLMLFAEEKGAKVVLVGDTRQLQPVDAGGAFRLIQQKIGAAELSEIRRQRSEWQREAVQNFAGGKAEEALAEYEKRGLLHVEKDHEATLNKLVARWHDNLDPYNPGESLMIAARRMDVRQLNQLAREALIGEGRLDASRAVRLEGHEYAPGDRIIFLKNDADLAVKNGSLATILRVEQDGENAAFTAVLDSGEEVSWITGRYDSFQHGYAVTAHKSQGMTVDRAFVLLDESMSDLHWSYVAASRTRDETEIFTDELSYEDTRRLMSQSREKHTSQDYELDDELEL